MSTNNSSSRKRYWLCPLYSFNCDSYSVDLAEGIQITAITPALVNYLQSQYSDFFWSPNDPKYMVVFPQSMVLNDKSKSLFAKWHVSDLLVTLITALRLCRSGVVTPGALILSKLQNSTFSIVSISSKSSLDDILPGEEVGPILTSVSKPEVDFGSIGLPEYQFYRSDVPEITKLMEVTLTYRMTGKPYVLNEALRRFNTSYRGELEDRLIDQMISFESLYLGDSQELGYKLALRAGFLLGKDEESKKDIIDDMKKAYDLRSKVVHGSKQVEQSELKEIIPKTEEYLRHSIKKFLVLLSVHSLDDLKKGKDRGLAKLDENILSNGRLLSSYSSTKV